MYTETISLFHPLTTNATKMATTTNQTLSQIRIPTLTSQLNLWGYLFILFFGAIGNTLGFLTFFRPTLRNISTGCLFILLTISDTLYLVFVLSDFLEFGLQVIYPF